MIPKLLTLAVLTVVGLVLTIKGSPSYVQIIGLVIVMAAVGGSAAAQLQESAKGDSK